MSTLGKRVLRITGTVVAAFAAVLVLLILYVQLRWDSADGRPAPQLKAPTDSASIARGEHIFKYQSTCWACHGTPGSPDHFVPSGGTPFDLTKVGPGFGMFYSRNITPDMETGIGSWTDGEIVQALREGVNKDRQPLFPIMPIDWYHGMADEDVLSVVAYLRTLPPVKNAVPDRELSFVAKALFTFGMVGPMPPVTAPVVAPPRGVTAEYGRYVASNLADCADCHTPRNLDDGKFYMDSLFAGSSFRFGGGNEGPILAYARNITPEPEDGIGGWTEEQFIQTVTTGVTPHGRVLAPIMPYAYYKFWSPEDLRAVYLFLKSLPPIKREVPAFEYEPRLAAAHGSERGRLLFLGRCQICHGKEGKGAPPTNVVLAEVAPGFTDEDLKDFIRNGQLNLHMPAFGKTLNPGELDDLVAHIRSWDTP